MFRQAFIARTLALLAVAALAGCSQPPRAESTAATRSPTTPAPTATPRIGCNTISAAPTPIQPYALPPITQADYVRGDASAAATLLLYCDFQSAECEVFNRVLDQLQKDHPNDIRVVLRPFPVPVSVVAALDKSDLATRAALAAADQAKFWEMRDLLHAHYTDWYKLSPPAFEKWIVLQAASLKVDQHEFAADIDSPATEARARALYMSASGIGISGIPTVFINGGLQSRATLSYQGLESTISLIALGTRQFKSCPAFDVDASGHYLATIHTQKGDIEMQLFADKAPLAVNSFVFLARQGWFDGVTFHRVIPGFVAQAGDPTATGLGGPGYLFKNEIAPDLAYDKPGVLGMANSGPDTNGSQFFITYSPQPQLDGRFTIFGQVISGMEVVESLTARDADTMTEPPPGDKILSVTIEEQ
jgi:cyclophilin family peptidyl-prolyl cis-trans isomerase/protein-disulfide isomerase